MALISIKGSPGVTTVGLALAATWPGPTRPVLVEADPAGGDLAARFELPTRPGLISLVAAARHQRGPAQVDEHVQPLLGGSAAVVVGGVGAHQADAAVDALIDLAAAWGELDRTFIVDCGRWDLESTAEPLLRTAAVVLWVARPRADELGHLTRRLPAADRWAGVPALVLVGRDGYRVDDVRGALGVPVMAVLPDDRRAARILCGRSSWRSAALRLPLFRSAAGVARTLQQHAATQPAHPHDTTPAVHEDLP